MSELTDLQARKAQLEKALANPNSRVSDNGKSVEKRSVAELKEMLTRVTDQIAALQSSSSSRVVRLVASKGT